MNLTSVCVYHHRHFEHRDHRTKSLVLDIHIHIATMTSILVYVARLAFLANIIVNVVRGQNETKLYRCKDADTSISTSKLCDWAHDCPSGDDEAHCGNCHFNDPNNLCGYSIVNSKQFYHHINKFNDHFKKI